MLLRAAAACRPVRADIRHLPFAANSFDAAINLWHSFGYFTADQNEAVLRDAARVARRHGLLMLDLYTRSLFERATGRRAFVRAGIMIEETTHLQADRVTIDLVYDGGRAGADRFEWQIFSPDELQAMAARAGWELLDRFENFDAQARAGDDCARCQYLFHNVTAA
jgi:ubiquinone/menaquinone biosynthesis C-methylase UbiE